jgi:hypothetical protein
MPTKLHVSSTNFDKVAFFSRAVPGDCGCPTSSLQVVLVKAPFWNLMAETMICRAHTAGAPDDSQAAS